MATLVNEHQSSERYHRVKAVAERFDLTEGSIRNLISQGKLRAVKFAGAVRIPESAIAELLSRGTKADREAQ
jgi:excisionase family DNA binding protein